MDRKRRGAISTSKLSGKTFQVESDDGKLFTRAIEQLSKVDGQADNNQPSANTEGNTVHSTPASSLESTEGPVHQPDAVAPSSSAQADEQITPDRRTSSMPADAELASSARPMNDPGKMAGKTLRYQYLSYQGGRTSPQK